MTNIDSSFLVTHFTQCSVTGSSVYDGSRAHRSTVHRTEGKWYPSGPSRGTTVLVFTTVQLVGPSGRCVCQSLYPHEDSLEFLYRLVGHSCLKKRADTLDPSLLSVFSTTSPTHLHLEVGEDRHTTYSGLGVPGSTE